MPTNSLFMLDFWNPDLRNDSYRFIWSSVNWDNIEFILASLSGSPVLEGSFSRSTSMWSSSSSSSSCSFWNGPLALTAAAASDAWGAATDEGRCGGMACEPPPPS
uniref:Uncharacterized protein n=1 Tax=Arundo donax TaxID=35708 RepID=A0A0A9D9A9_ARUDO